MRSTGKNCFRVLDLPPHSGAYHMALDRVILEAHTEGLIPNTIRFLRYEPCVLVGLHQNVQLEVNVPYCQEQRISINRRLTGGGSIYLGPVEFGWEMYAAKNTPGIPRKVESMYRTLCEAVALGLQKLGLQAAYRPVNDVEISGRKIAGTGGTEKEETFVFQCSILVDPDIDEMLRVLRSPLEKLADKGLSSMRQRVTTLREQLGRVPPHEQIRQAVLAGLEDILGLKSVPGELTAPEMAQLSKYLPYFESDAWIYRVEEGCLNTVDALANYKAPGGLLRVQMRLSEDVRFIRYVVISGDFFIYPSRTVNDLETCLKNSSADKDKVALAVKNFFSKRQVEMPGLTEQHFIDALCLALDKARESRFRTNSEPG